MAFPRRLLTDGEQVVLELRPHWSVLGWALPAPVVVAAAVVAVTVTWPSGPVGVFYGLLALLALSASWLGVRVLRRRTTSLVVTSARLVRRAGILGRRGLDIRLERVNEVSYHQSIWQRVIGSGDLVVEMGGERGLAVFDHTRRPASVAAVLQEQVTRRAGDIAGGRRASTSTPSVSTAGGEVHVQPSASARVEFDATPPSGTAALGTGVPGTVAHGDAGQPGAVAHGDAGQPGSVAQRLIELEDLHHRGLLSDSEYEAKRASLIDRL